MPLEDPEFILSNELKYYAMSASVSAIGATSLIQLFATQKIAEESQPLERKLNQLSDLRSGKSGLAALNSSLSSLNNLLGSLQKPESNPFGNLNQVVNNESDSFDVEVSLEADAGSHSVQVLRLAKADTRFSKVFSADGDDLASFFADKGEQTFSINLASPTDSNPDNRIDIDVTVNPAGETNRDILDSIASSINDAIAQAAKEGRIGAPQAARAQVVLESDDSVRLTLRSGNTGFTHRLGLEDSSDSLLSKLQLNRNAAINTIINTGEGGSSVTDATTAKLNGSSIAGPFTVDESNNQLDIRINGSTINATLTTGFYESLDDLASELESQIGAGVSVTAGDNYLAIETVETGSDASIQVLGGTALELLGLGTDNEAASIKGTGIAGPIVIDTDNRTFEINVDGEAISAQLSEGTYASLNDIAAELETKIGADKINVLVEDNALKIETATAGADSSLQITGGDALDTLGFGDYITNAVLIGDAIDQIPITITNRNDQLKFRINGKQENIKIERGTYNNLEDLAASIEDGFKRGGVSVSVVDNAIKIETVSGGASSSIQVVGGDDAVALLGFEVMDEAVTGRSIDAVFGADGNPISKVTGTDEEIIEGGGNGAIIRSNPSSGGMIYEVGTSESNSLLNSLAIIDGVEFVSDTNQLKDVIPGVSINLKLIDSEAHSFTIEQDISGVKEGISSLINTVNVALGEIQEKVDALSTRGLSEDTLLIHRFTSFQHRLGSDIASTSIDNPDGPQRLSDIGFTLGAGGTIEISEDALNGALEDDPNAVAELFNGSNGIITQLQQRVNSFENDQNVVERSLSSFNRRIENVQKQILSIEGRIDRTKELLEEEAAFFQNQLSVFQLQQETLFKLFRTRVSNEIGFDNTK